MTRPVSPATIALAMTLAASGSAQIDFCPTAREVILNTDFTQVQTCNGPPINVVGGVFRFRNVTIPRGVTVRGVGTNPMVWLVTGTFRVDGRLSVDGGDGESVVTLNSAQFPSAGGAGACTGGSGGFGSPNATDRSFRGGQGRDAFQAPGRGGHGGRLACVPACGRASAGGGGSFATIGDPYFRAASGGVFIQQLGWGGAGCTARTLPGGEPGASPFVDGIPENDFWGFGFDIHRLRIIPGELARIRGGQGGGGGGDRALRCTANDPAFVNDNKGGGGGGGGGALIVFTTDRIIVGPFGRISADGGDGGGGEQAGGNNLGAGGGGGSGGMIVLGAVRGIELHTHGETFARGDYEFSLSADGGISRQGAFTRPIDGKYPPLPASAYGLFPSGGFGGMGIIQLITRIGTNTDGTNTVFDDSIDVVRGGTVLTGAEKQRYLAWRGWTTRDGAPVDDFGNATNIGADEGDIRPTPILMPLF